MAKSSSTAKREKQKRTATPDDLTKAMDAQPAEGVTRLPNGLEIQPTTLEHIRRFAEAGYLYAILDACDAPAVPEKARELGEEAAVSLFRGSAQDDYCAVAPHLFKVSPDTLDWIVATLWSGPWGVFVMSKAALPQMQKHFRRFLIVQLADGEKWFFRYYDPRILKVYLPACNDGELSCLFECVRAFGIPNEGAPSASLFVYSRPAASPPLQSATGASWRISDVQEKRFQEDALADFERRMNTHLAKFFPEQCEALGPEQMHAAIRYGIERAATYGFTAERDVCKYIDLMFTLGKHFDIDPRLPWAAEILGSTDEPDDKFPQLCSLAERTINERNES